MDVQRALLPGGLPVLPSVRIAGSYLPADAPLVAGGDWFDAIPVRGGQVALVVGDVAGHGVAASAVMAQLRAVLQDRLDDTGDLLTALWAADRVAGRERGARGATVCLVVLDPADGTLTHCSAGHPPPLIIGTDGARFLPGAGAGPLGTGATYTVATTDLGPEEVLLLYTDGIYGRPGRHLADTAADFARLATNTVTGRGIDGSAVDRVCGDLPELVARRHGHPDDLALLAAQRRVPASPLRRDFRLGTGIDLIPTARIALVEWLRELDAGQEDTMTLSHAATELVTNAVEHSHPDAPDGHVTLTAELTEQGVVRFQLADDGHWQHRARPGAAAFRRDRGLGLAMTAQFVDDLHISHGPTGTTATVRHRLCRPAQLPTPGDTGATTPREHQAREVMVMLDQPHASSSRVAVHGPLDAGNAAVFATELDRLTLGGTHPLTVDLTSATHLSSATIATLHARREPLTLYAPPASPAHHMLTIAGLAHATTDPDITDEQR